MIKKIIAGVIIAFALIVFVIFSTLLLVNYDQAGKDFITYFNTDIQNIGKIKLNKFPIPYLTIENVQKDEVIELEKIDVYFSPFSLLKFKPQVNHLNILNAKFYINNNKLNIYEHEFIIDNFIKHNLENINVTVNNLSIINKQDYSVNSFTNCTLKQSNLSTESTFKATNSITGDITGSIKQNKDSINLNLNVNSDNYNLKLFQIYKNSKLEGGNGEYDIKNIAAASYNLLPDLGHIFKDVNQNIPVNVKFNIGATNDIIAIKDIIINSNLIEGTGLINIARNSQAENLINLNFSKIDLSNLFNANTSAQTQNPQAGARFVFANNLLKTNIVIDQIVLSNDESLNKVIFSANLTDDILKIEEFSGSVKSGGKFKFIGNVTQNNIRSMFDGKIFLEYNNLNSLLNILGYNNATTNTAIPFILSSDLRLTLIDLYFKNFSLVTKNLNIFGDISTKFIASTPRLNATLNFSALDLTNEQYPIISPIIEFTKNLAKDMKNPDYLNKFIAVRTLNSLTNFDVTIDSVNYNNILFDKVNLLANTEPGHIKVNNLDFRINDNYLSSGWNLDATNVQPNLAIEIKNGAFATDYLSPSSLLNLREILIKNYSLDKATIRIFGGLSKLTQHDLILENLKFDITNDNNLVRVDNLETDILLGKFQGTGNILLDTSSIDFVYALNNIDLVLLSNMLPKIFSGLNGKCSFNGKFSTFGTNLQNQLYNLTTKSQFLINTVKFNNFDIDSFISKINEPSYNSQNLESDVSLITTTGESNINNIQGNIELQKGIAMLSNVTFSTNYSSGASSIAINIYNFDMDSSTILSFYAPNALYNANIVSSDTNNKDVLVNINLKMQGNIFAPQKTIDNSALKKLFEKPVSALSQTVNPS